MNEPLLHGASLTATGEVSRLRARLGATALTGGRHAVDLTVTVGAPWYVFAPGQGEGVPTALSAERPAVLTDVDIPVGLDGRLTGTFRITGTLQDAGPGDIVVLRTQACNGRICEMPTSMRLRLRPAEGTR